MFPILKFLQPYKMVCKNTFYLSLIEVVHLVMPFIALPYIISTVGAENYGKIVFAQAVAAYFAIFVNFGLDILAVKRVAQCRNSKEQLRLILGSVLMLKGTLCLIGLLIFSGLIWCWPRARADWNLFYCAYLVCLTDVFFTSWFFQGMEKMFMITVIKTSSIVVYLGLLLLLVRTMEQYPLIPLLQSGSLLLTSLFGFYYMCKKEKIVPVIPTWRYIWKLFRESVPFFFSRGSVVINNTIATLVIGVTLGNHSVAVYDLAQKLARTALIPVSMVIQAIYPHNARYRDRRFALRAFGGIVCLSLFGLTVLYWIAPYLVDYLGNHQLQEAIPLLRFFEIYILIGVLSVYSGTPLLVAWGYSKPFNRSVIISTGALLLIYGIFYACSVGSTYLFCAALMFSELIILLYRAYFCFKYKIIVWRPA